MPYLYRTMDLGIIMSAAYLSFQFRFSGEIVSANFSPSANYTQLVLISCLVFLLISNKVYRSWRGIDFLQSIISITGVWSLTCLLILLGLFFSKTGTDFSRYWIGTWFGLAYAELVIFRVLLTIGLRYLRLNNLNIKRIAIIGKGPLSTELTDRVSNNRSSGFVVTHHIDIDNAAEIYKLAKEPLDEIWIALPLDQATYLRNILEKLNNSSANIKFIPDLFTFRLINHGATEVLGMPMLDLSASPFTGANLLLKSMEDFLLSIVIIILISPILLLTAIGVKLTSRGPILYTQERIGLNGSPFSMYKFRSMAVETEKNGAHWGGSDSKVTNPFSAFIRKFNIDELPQFFNVLKGDMSIVGPRPERTEFINDFAERIPSYMKKHLVKAGITGWAQVHGLRGDTDLNKRIEYDLFYIENWSMWLDFKIILMTIIQSIVPVKKNSDL